VCGAKDTRPLPGMSSPVDLNFLTIAQIVVMSIPTIKQLSFIHFIICPIFLTGCHCLQCINCKYLRQLDCKDAANKQQNKLYAQNQFKDVSFFKSILSHFIPPACYSNKVNCGPEHFVISTSTVNLCFVVMTIRLYTECVLFLWGTLI